VFVRFIKNKIVDLVDVFPAPVHDLFQSNLFQKKQDLFINNHIVTAHDINFIGIQKIILDFLYMAIKAM